jgi:hypothetical protein
MGIAKGKKTSENGDYWCNIYLKTGKPKLVIGKCIDEEKRIFKLRSCSAQIIIHNTIAERSNDLKSIWTKIEDRNGWFYIIVNESDVNEFFDWNYKSN